MYKTISEIRIGMKSEYDSLPISCACDSFTVEDKTLYVVVQYTNPFCEKKNPFPEKILSVFRDYATPETVRSIYSEEFGLAETLFLPFLEESKAVVFAHDGDDKFKSLSICCAVTDVRSDTKVMVFGSSMRAMVTDKKTKEYRFINTPDGSCIIKGFYMGEDNNLFIGNNSFIANVFNHRDNRFYFGFGDKVFLPLDDIMYFAPLNDLCYIGIDFGFMKDVK